MSKLLFLGSLISAFAAFASFFVAPQYSWLWQALLALAVVLLGAFFATERKNIKSSLKKPTVQFGLNSTLLALLCLGVVVFLNLIFVKYDWKLDLTKNKLHTLAEQSVKVAQNLKDKVDVHVFVPPGETLGYQKFLDRYLQHTDKLKLHSHNPYKDLEAVNQYKVTQMGTVIVDAGTRTERFDVSGSNDPKLEEKFTNALIQAAKGSKRKAYFLTGHGEKPLGGTGRGSLQDTKEAMSQGRYEVAELSLIKEKDVPQDAELVVVAGPRSEFFPGELDMLSNYLTKRNGAVLMLLEPESPPSLTGWLAKYGVQWKPKRVVAEFNQLIQMAGGNPLVPVVASYGSHPIGKELQQQPSVFPTATPVEKIEKGPEGLKIETLLSTSPMSYEVAFTQKIKVDEKNDRRGPLTLGVAVSSASSTPATEGADKEKKSSGYRLVVMGDSEFASNGVRNFGVNADLLGNALSWLADEEDLIAIRPKATNQAQFDLTDTRMRVINFASMILVPMLVLVSGMVVWFSRRNR